MNQYTLDFFCRCPVNNLRVAYTLTVRVHAATIVRVEDLLDKVEGWTKVLNFHEQLADLLATNFPGDQVLVAHHHGVDIRTEREGRNA